MGDFLQLLKTDVRDLIREDLGDPAPMIISEAQQLEFDQATNCWICGKRLGEDRVRDHDHVSGDYRGPAHSWCNLQLEISPEHVHVPIVFHNLKGYDSHFIVRKLGEIGTWDVTVVNANGLEKVCDLNSSPCLVVL